MTSNYPLEMQTKANKAKLAILHSHTFVLA